MKRNIKLVSVIVVLISLSTIGLAKDKAHDPNALVNQVLKDKESRQKMHMFFSAACFNKCRKYIEKKDKTPEDIEDMVLLANASLWHWKQRTDCKPLNLSMAKQYGQECLKISKENRCGPFAAGYAYELLARANAMEKNSEKAKEYLELATKELTEIKDEFNKKLLADDLQSIEKLLKK